jgi:dTDP-glucose 4,6-dehydratase
MMCDYDIPMNLGNPAELSILEFAKLIKTLCESKSEIVYEQLPQDDPMQRRPDIRKAKAILGWEPKVGLEEGVKRTIEYFRDGLVTR